ncbi:MAG: hypothetical protein JXB49_34440 [Bacteroidales bacterium]|nr:hypothetical protein [Bacteroidales bacterium]
MEMKWHKLGRLFCPQSNHPKLLSHASNPLAVKIEGDLYRIFYSGRDSRNRSSVGFVDIDICERKIIHFKNDPIVEHGPEGSYYSHGISIGNILEIKEYKYMLFMAWQIRPGEHWRGDIGRLYLDDQLNLHIIDKEPFFSMDAPDPISLSYPFVMKMENNEYYMWYGSTITWDAGNSEMLHVINYAKSTDGITWHRKGVALPFKLGLAQAFSRPCVIGNSIDGFHMWFSYRGSVHSKYRIGHAYSSDGDSWKLKLDDAGIDVSSTGWDSEMIEYPFVFDHKGERYMLYNGNEYGLTGFGLAILEQD